MRLSQILKMTFLVVFLLGGAGCATEKALTQMPKPDVPAPKEKVSTIQKISFGEEENYTRIKIEGSEAIAPPFYKVLPDPLRIAIDIPNIDLKQIKNPIKIENGTIGEVLTTQFDDKGRVEISLLQMTQYNLYQEEKNLIIDIEKVKKVVEVKEVKKGEEPIKETKINPLPSEPKKEEPAPAAPPLSKAKEVRDVLLEEKGDVITIHIVGDGGLENYNSFKLDSPPRLVLDIWGVETRYPKKLIKTKIPFIKQIRMGQYPDKVRFVFDASTSKLPPYQINRKDDQLIVSMGNVPLSSEPQMIVAGKPSEGNPVPKVKEEKLSTLTDIHFKQMDHKSRVMVALTEEPKFESRPPTKNMIVVDIKNASAPKQLQRELVTNEFESAVNLIAIENVKTGKANDIRISIKLREEVPFETSTEGKMLYIDIEKPKKMEAKAEVVPETKKEEVKKEEVKKEEVKKEEVKKEEKPSPPASATEAKKIEEGIKILEEGRAEKVYAGRKLSLDFKDADIKNILRLIAEVSNLNIIAGDEVTGKITMRLVEVPWDQALDIILQSKNLGMTRVGNVVRIAPLEALKREVQTELEAKRAKEKLEDLMMELIPINYAAAKEIMPQVKSVLSDRGDVKVDERTNTLIIRDIPKTIPTVKGLVKSLDLKTPQVLIEARIVEATLAFQRELGVSWGFLVSTGESKSKTGYVGGGTSSTSTLPGPGTPTPTNKAVDLPATLPLGASGGVSILEFLFTSSYGLKQLDIAISAYENKGDLNVISSPKIATLDNKEASIEQGLRIPYTKLTTEGTPTEDFIDANLKLTVTPHVTNDGHIRLTIKVKKDEPSPVFKSIYNTPSIDKKEAITEVLIKDNGVVAIGGIYTITKEEGGTGVPLFNKIPLLGWLFKKETKRDERKDLLIFISPKIFKEEV